MSNLNDNWLSTRNRAKIVPKKKGVIKRRSSLPKPRKSSNVAAFPMTQNSPPPKLLRTATKQSKLNDFFQSRNTGTTKALGENRQALEVSPAEVNQQRTPDGPRNNKFDTLGNNVKIPGYFSGIAIYDSKPSLHQGKENNSSLYERATNEHNMQRGGLHQAEELAETDSKFVMNSNDSNTAFTVQHPASRFQNTQWNAESLLLEKYRNGVKRGILIDEINKPTEWKRQKKGNAPNDPEIFIKVNCDAVHSHRGQLSSKAAEEKTADEKLQDSSEDNQKNLATSKKIAHDEQFLQLSQCFQKSSSTKALDCAESYNAISAHNNVGEKCKVIEQDRETKDTANNECLTTCSTMYKTADVIQFEHGRVNTKLAGKPTDEMTDRDDDSGPDNSSLDLPAEDNLEYSQGSGLLLETQLHSEMTGDDDDDVIENNTELNLDDFGDSMGQSLELCTQFTLSSQ